MMVRAVTCVSCLLVLGAARAEGGHAAARFSVDVRDASVRASGIDTLAGRQRIAVAPFRQAGPTRTPEGREAPPPWWGWRLLGRLHPLVVHFPIGLLTTAALIEALHLVRRRTVPSEPGMYCLAFGVAGAVVSAALGTLNAAQETVGGAAATTLERHQTMGWIAVMAAVAALGAGQVARRHGSMRSLVAYVALVFLTGAAVGATGHLGGELVYGSQYITEVLPWNQEQPSRSRAHATAATQPADVDFARDVKPIFEQTCVECHGPDKVKGRLRMDTVAGLQKGGKNGALVKAGDPENSLLLRRVLGLDGEDQMPLDKDPLTDAQVETLRRWVAAGARYGDASN